MNNRSSHQGFLARLWTRHVGAMLVRNTVVSTAVLLVGLAVLYVLVRRAEMDEVVAAGIGFIVSNSLHYVFGRTWIFRGTDRSVPSGYVYFLVNAGVGLVLTLVLFAALLEFTAIHFLIARVLVSIVAGLVQFVLNASLNFRQV